MKETKVLKVVECSGTPYEIGLQYGEACRANLQKSVEICLGNVIGFTNATTGQIVNKEELLTTAGKFLPMAEQFDPELIEFVKGQAQGAGMSFQEAFYLRCSYEMLWQYGQISNMCTTFAATGEATRNGKTILGRNIDFAAGDWPFDLLKIKYANGLEQLALCIAGSEMEVLNSNGYANSMNGTINEDYQLTLPFACYLPKAMRQRAIGDALKIFCQAARGFFYHVLASAEGDIIGFESISDDFKILQPEKDILVHSNHYLTEQFKKTDGIYTKFRDFPDTFLRVTRIRRLMERHYGDITPETMMDIFADHNNYPYSLCKHPDTNLPPEYHSKTLASVIMVPADRTMYIACGNPCQYEYVAYKL